MSEIRNNETNETKETSKSTENKELSTYDKLNSLDDEKQKELNKEFEDYKKENPDATRKEIKEYFSKRIDDEYKNENKTEDTEEDVDDLEERQKRLNDSEYLSDDDKLYMNYYMKHADPASVVETFEKKEELYKNKTETGGTEDNNDTTSDEDDEDRGAKEKFDDLEARQNRLNNSKYLSDDEKLYMNYSMKHADPVSVVEAFEDKEKAYKKKEELEKKKAEAEKNKDDDERCL